MHAWADDSVFYHLYPLGFCGAPKRNDFHSAPVARLEKLHGWLDHLQDLGVNALYLGPVFESESHGYDTADYRTVDRRLGTNETLSRLSRDLHERGMRLVLDGVFNHVSRSFGPFKDLREKKVHSPYRDWFSGLDFSRPGPAGDAFRYDCWEGHVSLVKLNLSNPEVRKHLFGAVELWMNEFGLDGLRLDVAYCMDTGFLAALADFCRSKKTDFWLMGEMVHGDYRKLVHQGKLDSVTNYECSKGLWSSHLDGNYFEIAYSLDRQFGTGGMYREFKPYSFVDNHDVDRAASRLTDQAHLYPLYGLLFTMPGIPSVYYGSEWGIEGCRTPVDDSRLRPCLDLDSVRRESPNRDLASAIGKFSKIRKAAPPLRYGSYRKLHVAARQFAFSRTFGNETIIVALNAASTAVSLELETDLPHGTAARDLLNPGDTFVTSGGKLEIPVLHPCWARILSVRA